MPDYRYVAIDPQGRERKGRLTAANDAAARAASSFVAVSRPLRSRPCGSIAT